MCFHLLQELNESGYLSSCVMFFIRTCLMNVVFIPAHELLSQWVNDKIRLDNDMDEFDDEPWNKKSLEVKREWDHLVDNNNEEYGMNYYRKKYKDEEGK